MVIFVDITENESVKETYPLSKANYHHYYMITGQRRELGCKVVLFTNRKAHTGFQFLPKLETLNDLEWRNDRRRARSLQ